MPGVAETLPALATCNRLILVTKGDVGEQLGKLQRSQLARYFTATEMVFEKNRVTYRQLLHRYRAVAARSWMIGNSPRSVINPAKAAGVNTVFIPYHTRWQHELEGISPNGSHPLVLDHFGQLADYFLDSGEPPVAAFSRSPAYQSARRESRA